MKAHLFILLMDIEFTVLFTFHLTTTSGGKWKKRRTNTQKTKYLISPNLKPRHSGWFEVNEIYFKDLNFCCGYFFFFFIHMFCEFSFYKREMKVRREKKKVKLPRVSVINPKHWEKTFRIFFWVPIEAHKLTKFESHMRKHVRIIFCYTFFHSFPPENLHIINFQSTKYTFFRLFCKLFFFFVKKEGREKEWWKICWNLEWDFKSWIIARWSFLHIILNFSITQWGKFLLYDDSRKLVSSLPNWFFTHETSNNKFLTHRVANSKKRRKSWNKMWKSNFLWNGNIIENGKVFHNNTRGEKKSELGESKNIKSVCYFCHIYAIE